MYGVRIHGEIIEIIYINLAMVAILEYYFIGEIEMILMVRFGILLEKLSLDQTIHEMPQ